MSVIVIGAGPAGCAAALTLRAADVPVTVLDRGASRAARRCETLPGEAQPLLARLGLWPEFQRAGHLPSAGMCSVWADAVPAFRDGITQPHGAGWHVDRDRFDASLARAVTDAGASLVSGTQVVSCRHLRPGRWEVRFRSGDRLRRLAAPIVIDASGRASALARRRGAGWATDRLMCAYVTAGPSAGGRRHALVEAVEGGWWYVGGTAASTTAAFFSDPDVIRGSAAARPDGWRALLAATRHAAERLGDPGPVPAVRTAVAASGCLRRMCGDGWIAAGDAAVALDPLTSAGITGALRGGIDAAEAVRAVVDGRATDGDVAAPARYQQRYHARYTSYLLQRAAIYGMETRWPDSPFWARRRYPSLVSR